jgi:hypothetical protein
MSTNPVTEFSLEAWRAKGRELFGEDPMKWRFVCPSCKHVASVQDWKDAGAPGNAAAFSCVGRWKGGDDKKTFRGEGGPCFYAGGGLFAINPVTVIDPDGKRHQVFAFDEPATA